VSDPCEAEQKKKHVAGVFDRSAETYGRVGPPFFAHFADRLVQHAQIPRGARVLDVATGRGAVLFLAAERVGPTGAVTGIDLSGSMVKATAREASQRGLTNVDVRQMDVEGLLFPDHSFDHVLCGFGVFFFPRIRQALSEVRRVLKPGGHLAVSTWGKEDERWERLYDLSKAHLPADPGPPDDSSLEPSPDFETPHGMRALMRETGFDDVRVVEESRVFVYATTDEWWATQWSHGRRAVLEKIRDLSGAEGLARFQSETFEHLKPMTRPDGIHHPLPVLVTLAARPRER
jgi:ubiquinone/menaquinone biosynthesis C-methylase UbiE